MEFIMNYILNLSWSDLRVGTFKWNWHGHACAKTAQTGSLLALLLHTAGIHRSHPSMENVVVEDGEKGMPVAALATEWERCDAIRSHLRVEGNVIFKLNKDPTVKEACQPWIHGYLTPMLIRMASYDGKPQPLVDPLRDEIANLYKTASKQVDDCQVVHDSWMTRKFLGLVKMKARKKLPSTDVWLLLSIICYIFHDVF